MATPLDNHLDEVLTAREAGKSFATIARELGERHGITVGKRGLSAWYRRRQRRTRERRIELEDFGRGHPASVAGPGIADFSTTTPPVALPDDDWTAPARPRRIELKVVRSSQES